MDRPRLLVLMGSGETSGTMVATHRQVLARFPGGRPHAHVVDTPYGFQENADDLTARAVEHLDRHVGHRFAVTRLRGPEPPDVQVRAVAELDRADVVFAGPGSPSYLLRSWRGTPVPAVLRDKLRRGGALVFASAAACTVGRVAAPVYEIYKVGEDPRWLDGLDLTAELGLAVAVLPHFDNAEGGTHDTRYCFLGGRRLRVLEAQLPAGVAVLGIDEHTGVVVDLDADRAEVAGRGGLTVRRGERTVTWPSGASVPLDEIREAAGRAARGGRTTVPQPASTTRPLAAEVDRLRDDIDAAFDAGDGIAAAASILELDRLVRDHDAGPEADEARDVLRAMIARLGQVADAGLHDHRDVVAPYVDALLELRAEARDARDFARADAIRDRLLAAGLEVRDASGGTEWRYPDG